nr:HutD family protein [Blastococcus sp. URHD0036]
MSTATSCCWRGGLRLRFDDGEVVTLERGGDTRRFAGERSLVGEPVAGPTRQLNLMWRRDRLDAVVAAGEPVRASELAVHPEEAGGIRVEFHDADVGVVCRLTPRGPVRS